MDKNTLSNYGWIVIAVLVLSVMIALATPFGSFIEQGVRATTEGLFDTSKNAVNTAFEDFGVQMGDQEFEEGYKGVNADNQQGNTPQVKPEEITNYTDEEIANNPQIFGIGETSNNLVVAVFSDDNKTLDVYKNTEASDGKVGCAVYKIFGTDTWSYDKKVDKIVIHEGITSISEMAFWFAGASEILLPDTLTTIKTNAFNGNLITSITIPKNMVQVSDYSFMQCDYLEKVIVAEGMEETCAIGFAFAGVTSIKEFILPNTIKTITSHTFDWANGDIRLPSSVTTINEYAFADANATIYVPKTVTNIKFNAFAMVQGTIYCETQEVADFIINNTENGLLYNTPIVDASKF